MPRLAANLTMMFGELALEERFAAAAAQGFEAVEILFPYELERERLADLLAQNGLQLALFNLPPGIWENGERGIAILPGRRSQFIEGVEKGLAYARATGCRLMHCMAGLEPQSADRAALARNYVESLRVAADMAIVDRVTILIEPLNRIDMPGYFLNAVEQAADIIAEAGRPNIAIQYDIYHQSRSAGELLATFERHQPLIRHIQIAGNPGRNEPDVGEVNYDYLLAALDSAGYRGFVGCEYRPLRGTVEGLRWAKGWLPDRTLAAQVST